MKPILLLAIGIALMAQSGCEKAAAPETAVSEREQTADIGSLTGAWELRFAYGGFNLPNTSPVHQPGNGRIWHFTDSSYAFYAKGQLLTSGTYQHIRDTSPATGTLMDAIVMPQNGHLKIHYHFSKDTLVMYQGSIAADGTIEKYVPAQLPVATSK